MKVSKSTRVPPHKRYKDKWEHCRKTRKPNGQWAMKHTQCTNCGTTENDHHANGLCRPCYTFEMKRHHPEWVDNFIRKRRELREQEKIKQAMERMRHSRIKYRLGKSLEFF